MGNGNRIRALQDAWIPVVNGNRLRHEGRMVEDEKIKVAKLIEPKKGGESCHDYKRLPQKWKGWPLDQFTYVNRRVRIN